MADLSVVFKIGLDGLASLKQGLDDAKQAFTRQVDGVQAFNQALQNGHAAIQALGGALAGLAGLEAIRQAVVEAQSLSVAQAQLARSLATTGHASDAAKAQFFEQAESLAHLTGNGQSTVLEVQRLLLSFGGTAEKARALTPLVLDLSAALGVDATSAARLVRAALDGDTEALARLNIRATDFNDLVDQLTARVGGQAEALQAAKGPMGELALRARETREALGALVLPAVNQVLAAWAASTTRAANALKRMSEEGSDARSFIVSLGNAAAQIAPAAAAIASVAAAAVAATGVWRILTPAINGARVVIFALTGPLQSLSSAFGLGNALAATWTNVISSGVGGVARMTAAIELLGPAVAAVGAAFAGWQIGRALGQIEIAGDTIQNRLTRQLLKLAQDWHAALFTIGAESAEEFKRNLQNLDDAIADTSARADARDKQKATGGAPSNYDADAERRRKLTQAEGAARLEIDKATDAKLRAQLDGDLAARLQTLDSYEEVRRGMIRTAAQEELAERLIAAREIANVDQREVAERTASQLADIHQQQAVIELETEMRAKRLDARRAAQEIDLRQTTEQAQRQRQAYAEGREITAGDFRTPDFDKRDSILQSFDSEIRLLDALIAKLRQKRELETEPTLQGKYDEEIDRLSGERHDTVKDRAQVANQPNPYSWADQATSSITKLRESFGTLQQAGGKALTGTITAAIDGVSEALTKAIFHTKNWGQAFAQVGEQIVMALIKIGIQYLVAAAAAAVLDALTGGQGGAAVSSAMNSSIVSSPAAMASGGLTPSRPTLTWIGEKGSELVVPHDVTSQYSPAEQSAILSGNLPTRPGAAMADDRMPSSSASTPDLHLHILSDPVDSLRIAADHPDGQHILVDANRGTARQFVRGAS